MSGLGFSSWGDDLSFSKQSKVRQKEKIKDSRLPKKEDNAIPKQIVIPLTQGQFPPFSHFFVTVRCAHNLVGCDGQSLFMRIRVHPSIPVVETPSAWCTMREVNFNVSYSFDFTQLPPFNLTDFTPVIELYKRSPKKPELLSLLLLPLRVCEIVDCDNLSLTFLYREKSCILKDLVNDDKVGSIVVTLAMGFPVHQKYMTANSAVVSTPAFAPNVVAQPINERLLSPPPKPRAEKRSSDEDEERPRRKKRVQPKPESDYSWVNEAIRLGWKPPGSTDFDWKGKAREKGWKPPHDQVYSSTGVTCDPNARGLRRAADIQTEPEKPREFSEKELLRMLHEKRRKKKRFLKIEPSCVFETPFKTAKLGMEPCLTLISQAPVQNAVLENDVSSSEQQEIHGEIEDLLELTSRNLKSFRISSDENSEYEEEEESDCGFFRRQESDGTAFMKKLALEDPQLLKMMELM